jgi:hypothetical protein
MNYPWLEDEDRLLRAKVAELGPRWAKMTQFFCGRSDVNIKNHYAALMARDISERRAKELEAAIARSNFSSAPIQAPLGSSAQGTQARSPAPPAPPDMLYSWGTLFGSVLTAEDWDSEESQRYRSELTRCFPNHAGSTW